MARSAATYVNQMGLWLALVITVAPALGAWVFWTPLPWYPRWLCLGLGLATSAVIAAARWRRAASREQQRFIAQYTAEETGSGRQRKKKRKARKSSRPGPEDAAEPTAPRPTSAARMLLYLGPPCCADQVKNGKETDVDCGGGTCPKCANTKTCKTDGDCASGICTSGACVGSCADKKKSGYETDVDCGGGTCPKCADHKKCNSPADCVSGACSSGACVAASCTDKTKNGTETDVDCGGAACPKCDNTKQCSSAKDCKSAICLYKTCYKCSTPGACQGCCSLSGAGPSTCILYADQSVSSCGSKAACKSCDDLNDCTKDGCSAKGACTNTAQPDHTSCKTNGLPGSCVQGKCVPGGWVSTFPRWLRAASRTGITGLRSNKFGFRCSRTK